MWSVASVLTCFAVLIPNWSLAGSVVWNQAYTARLCGDAGTAPYAAGSRGYPGARGGMTYCRWYAASNPSVSVEYRVRVIDAATGAVIPSGATVAAGTRVRYEFIPHSYQDITWFITGSSSDSPYGEWSAATPVLQCRESDLIRGRHLREYALYAQFQVAPPAKSIDGLPGTECSGTGADKTCTFAASGTHTASFVFAPTEGLWYGRTVSDRGCFGMNTPLKEHASRTTFVVGVPEQIIRHTITVSGDSTTTRTPGDPTDAPSTPTVSARGALSCIVGAPYRISLSATSTDSRSLRYLIDWDADGTTDELVPPSGYVSSGMSQTSSRTFVAAGQKSIRVAAQDDRGLLSAWKAFSFSCAVAPDDDDTPLEGTVGTVGTDTGATSADLTLRAIPSLVRSGESTRVNFSAQRVSSCVVTGTNGDRWEGLSSRIGGEESSPVRRQVIYTLTCLSGGETLRKSVTVNVIPLFQER